MSLFTLDIAGDEALLQTENTKVGALYASNKKRGQLLEKKVSLTPVVTQNESEDDDYFGLPPPSVDISKFINSTLAATRERISKTEHVLEEVTEKIDAAIRNVESQPKLKSSKRGRVVDLDHSDINPQTGKLDFERDIKTNVEQELQTTRNAAELEKLKELPKVFVRKQRQLNRLERAKTKGSNWYNLPATEVTDEVRNELKIVQMRSILDPKHFYKKNDLKVLPKYFQIGTVQHSPLDYYNERNTRKKKQSLVDELLKDEALQKFQKRKYKEVLLRTDKYAQRKAVKKMKKLKKRK